VLIVVLFHSVGSQASFFVNAVVHDSRSLAVADWFFFFCITFQMPLLFFVAGYFAVPSLQQKGAVYFALSKVFRLVIPAAIVFVLLNPVHRYLYHWSRDFEAGLPTMSYLEFVPHFFGGASWFEVKSLLLHEYSILHLWFITVLFTLFVVYALLSVAFPSLAWKASNNLQVCTQACIVKQMAVAGVVGWLGAALSLMFWPSFEWMMVGSFLTFEVPSIFLHVTYFGLGIAAYRSSWFGHVSKVGSIWAWLLPCSVMAVVMIVFDVAIVKSEMQLLQTYWIALLYWASTSIACLLFLGSFLTVMRHYCNTTSPVHKYLARTSYRVYLLHYVVGCCVQFAFFHMPGLSPYVVLIGTAIGSLAFTFLFVAAIEGPARWYAEATKRVLDTQKKDVLEGAFQQAG
jgi:glucans biosynthesis protein C